MIALRKLTLPLTLLACASAASADERVPATFDHAEDNLATKIEFPEFKGDAAARLRCAARVAGSGKFGDGGCYAHTAGDEVYIEAINKATKKARMNPATIDGRALDVYVQYQVEFTKKGDEQTIRIYNNPGLEEMIDAYGDDHIAPQRGLTREAWQQVCPQRTRWLVWAKAHVAPDGTASSFSIVPGEGAAITENCREAILATLNESVYLPAMDDGETVPSSFIEPFGN
ncbi:MAG: hypothetical protein U5K76_03825 [Woeseiaceae bacterium]|nr:hypothetical protein [Woeseiaceae bacterium]